MCRFETRWNSEEENPILNLSLLEEMEQEQQQQQQQNGGGGSGSQQQQGRADMREFMWFPGGARNWISWANCLIDECVTALAGAG